MSYTEMVVIGSALYLLWVTAGKLTDILRVLEEIRGRLK